MIAPNPNPPDDLNEHDRAVLLELESIQRHYARRRRRLDRLGRALTWLCVLVPLAVVAVLTWLESRP